ncbi:unnamed protein product [Ilex paraguariensis]|uniref:Uncharacterized protein n=1 Tax=Ilex paraguariensis TaxID=185542 RepID=A0ABC8SFZ6_9AQUA
MRQKQTHKSSFRESVKALEADIQHANTLAAALPRDCVGDYFQMKLSYSPFAPFLLFLIEWMDLDYSCTDNLPSYLGLLNILVSKIYVDGMPTMSSQERKTSLREFYAVIYPSLQQLEGDLMELMEDSKKRTRRSEILTRKRLRGRVSPLIKILREMMSVGFAWKIVPRWYCPIVATPCALTASMTGMCDLNHALFAEAA